MESTENQRLFCENDIINKQYYEGIKDSINCSICLEIVNDPVHCNKCQHCFCSECSKKLTSCPFRCQNTTFISSIITKNLLSKLKIKCNCGKVIEYDFIKNHKNKECINTNYQRKYIELMKKYKLLKQDYNKLNIKTDIKGKFATILSSAHTHPIQCIRRFGTSWTCNICRKSYDSNRPSYLCTLCDFDICYHCVKDTVTEGIIVNNMFNYYH